MKRWKHIFKLDPAKNISDENLKQLCHSGTDAIIIGGTDNVTYENVYELFTRVRRYHLPTILDVSTFTAFVPYFVSYCIPIVKDSMEKKWMIDIQHKALKQLKPFFENIDIYYEVYCILNDYSKEFQKTRCKLPFYEDILIYAHMAEHV